MKAVLYLLLMAFVLSGCAAIQKTKKRGFTIEPIGRIRKTEENTTIVIEEEYQPGLLGLEGFSHAYVLYWFDRNDKPSKRSVLQVHPRGNPQNPLTGVFATRSPARPNLIALSLCRIRSITENVIEIDTIDALPDSPVIDIKPYTTQPETKETAFFPDWVGSE